MTSPKIVFDADRLASLESYGILDTPAESGFDDIAQLAAHICNTPVALVSFVAGTRQWFKATYGFEGCETDLNSSVCVHVLGQPDLLVIPDLTKDERTRSNPLVIGEPQIRFYAGAPIVAASGQPLGSLCVIDGEPRPSGLTGKQADMLRALARQVMTQLELRRAVGERETAATERRSLEGRERASAFLYRSLFDTIDAGFCIVEVKFDGERAVDYRFVETNPAFERQTGLTDVRGKWMRDLAPAHEQHWFDLYGKVARTGEPIRFENPANELGKRWYDVQAFPIGPAENRNVGILFNDISDRREIEAARREAEAAQSLLNQELSHRMKNSFAMVLAIASQTFRAVPDQEPVEAFTSRVRALSDANDVLLQKKWTAARIGDVLSAVLGTLENPGRFDLAGPDVELGPRTTLSLSLLFHELATNAIKYGALSAQDGHVSVNWRLDDTADPTELVLSWEEIGGPPVGEPTRKGFGSRLIRMGLGSGNVDMRYLPTGLHAEFRAPLDQMQLP